MTLMQMVKIDVGAERIAPDFVLPAAAISEERWNEYRGLFRIAGVPDGIVVWSPSERVEFLASAKGLVTGGTVKGYAYLSVPPESTAIYRTLDERPATLKSDVRAYREIGDGWYIFYEWND